MRKFCPNRFFKANPLSDRNLRSSEGESKNPILYHPSRKLQGGSLRKSFCHIQNDSIEELEDSLKAWI
jgi:hypothetical protein